MGLAVLAKLAARVGAADENDALGAADVAPLAPKPAISWNSRNERTFLGAPLLFCNAQQISTPIAHSNPPMDELGIDSGRSAPGRRARSELHPAKPRLNQQMKRVLLAGLLPLALLGCGGGVDWEKPWRDSKGKTVPTDQIVSTYRGPDHCEWGSAVFLNLGWPPGTYAEYPSSSARQYVRDPEGLFESDHLAPLDLDVKLPPDARYTGYHLDRIELWISRADANEAVYIVRPERVERWPRLARHTICA